MDLICHYCKKVLADFNKHGDRAIKNRTSSFDWYYFCKEGECKDKYWDMSKEERDRL